ncbi:MAG: hypothetical protein ACODAD_07610 [Planctomycetota bacterium]
MSCSRGAYLRVYGRGVSLLVGAMLALTGWATTVHAAKPARSGESPRVERSARFVLHTDLSPAEAKQLLERLQDTLAEVADYWQRPPRGRIKCFVVDDLDNWPRDSLPHPMARLIIDRIGGVTLVDTTQAGIRTERQVTVLATSQQGAAEHEVVHAYCALMFGVTGPVWYREGIAQVFAYNEETDGGLHCPREMLSDLASHSPKPISKVVKCNNVSCGLYDSLVKKMKGRDKRTAFLSVDNWNQRDVRELNRLKQDYAWYWLACQLLYHNPNYQDRFKLLGQNYLANRRDTFDELFGPIMDQLSFEYEFTFRRFEPGYRIDLCHWDWDKRFGRGGESTRVRIKAARGYQASRLYVRRGQSYRVETRGSWKTHPRHPTTTAAGNPGGCGRLEGVVMKDYQLSKPFGIGAKGSFKAPSSGRLYLRCRDDWTKLHHNEGSIVVMLQHLKET